MTFIIHNLLTVSGHLQAIYVPFARHYTPAQARALRPLLAVLFINMFLLVWRNLYRVIEFAEPGVSVWL